MGRRFSAGNKRLELGIDALNATNSNAAWTSDYTSGPTFNYTTKIPQPRAARLTVLFDF